MKKILFCLGILSIYMQFVEAKREVGIENKNGNYQNQLQTQFNDLMMLIKEDTQNLRQDLAYERSSYGESVWFRPKLVDKAIVEQLFAQIEKLIIAAGKADEEYGLIMEIRRRTESRRNKLFRVEHQLYDNSVNRRPHERIQYYIDGLESLLELIDLTIHLT